VPRFNRGIAVTTSRNIRKKSAEPFSGRPISSANRRAKRRLSRRSRQLLQDLIEKFSGRLPRERQRHDPLRRRPVREQLHETMRERIGLPRSRRRQNHLMADLLHVVSSQLMLAAAP
jgi:hypothetical protein